MSPSIPQYLDALLTKAVDEAAARIEFTPGPDAGLVRYFERPDVCHCLEVPANLYREIVQYLTRLAHLSLKRKDRRYESWLRVDTEKNKHRVHVIARRGPAGASLNLHF